jgi:cellulose biosynthesis protein BcsQ
MIDCPPSLNMLTVNALTAAQSVIIPVQCEYYALEGLSALLDTIEKVRQSTNPGLRIEGVVRTMFDPRNRLANDVSAQIVEHFGEAVFETLVPAQRALGRSAQLRPADHPLRRQLARRAKLPGAGAGSAETVAAARRSAMKEAGA